MRPSKLRYIYARNALILSVLALLALCGGILSFVLRAYWTALLFGLASLVLFQAANAVLNKLRPNRINK